MASSLGFDGATQTCNCAGCAERDGIILALQGELSSAVKRWTEEMDRLAAAHNSLLRRSAALHEWNCTLTTAFTNTENVKLLLDEQVFALRQELYGRSTEKQKPNSKAKPIPSITDQVEKHRPRGADEANEKRQKTLKQKNEVPTEVVPLPAPSSKCHCPHCGDGPEQFQSMGKKSMTMLRLVPAFLVKEKHELESMRCRRGKTIVSAKPPAHFDQFNHAFVAQAITDKTENSLPIARQARGVTRTMGFNLPRQTLNRLFLKAGRALSPLANRILYLVARSEVVLADETFVVQQNQKKKAYVWTFNTDGLVAFVYSPNRSGDTPKRVLDQTIGELVVDYYSGYNAVTAPNRHHRANCNAHARRKFCEALQSAPEAQVFIDLHLELFLVEREAKDRGIVGTEEHLQLRRIKSTVTLEKLHAQLLLENQPPHPPKGKMAIAVHYALSNWEGLTRFLSDPRIPISNNRSERFLRVIAQGRKSYLTIGNTKAGEHIAALYTLTGCCLEAGVDPTEYYTDVLQRIESHPQSRLDELLPHNWKYLREQCQAEQPQAA